MEYTRELVLEKIRKLFPHQDADTVLAILEGYGAESSEWEPPRVHLGILKLCGGQIEQLPALVAMAKSDPRDVIAQSESPGQMRARAGAHGREVGEEDRRQWLEWLGADFRRAISARARAS